MYADVRVKIPEEKGKVTRKKIRGTTYIYYQTDRIYDPEKKYSIPKSTPIGKLCEDDPTMMIPNEKYLIFYPEAKLPEEKKSSRRSACLRVGAHMVLKRIIAEYHLDDLLGDLIGKDGGLFLDLAIYTIITENNAGQYYPDYAYNHPLFTSKMRMYSDSKVSDFIASIKKDQSVEFLNRWNENRDHREKIYISYDSTNKNCQAGDVDFVEFGHAKDDQNKPILNYSIAYDKNNREPLFYEMYPGSIVDVSQLQYMLEKTEGYGYRHVGFILDRGYFSKENIRYMDKCGYDFVIMMKGMKKYAHSLVMENKGTFEESRKHSIRDYKVSGTTVKGRLFPSDEKDRYFHIYFNESKRTSEREQLEEKIDRMVSYLKSQEGKMGYECPSALCHYFEPFYHGQGDERIFMFARERQDVIDREIKLCGYFIIITSEKMTAEEALELYKSRDGSEKLFRGDKSYLGNKSFRVHGSESVNSKIFIEFVALIIRNKFYTYLKDQMKKNNKSENYMTVPAALRELEKIEMIRQSDGNYRLDHAVTATQKEILKAFDLTERNIREQAISINSQLKMIEGL
ncbi:transposase [Gudongella oleilytica]|uniref:IS1634 family transposase n=1 Tax=Gudongella oleilytica TaxID=1582259 RepID=UPI000FF8A24E|nr:transposase [Gudongella oleilytica]